MTFFIEISIVDIHILIIYISVIYDENIKIHDTPPLLPPQKKTSLAQLPFSPDFALLLGGIN